MASNAQHEPTMEEILASIRKIISEDSTEAPAATAPAPVPATTIFEAPTPPAPTPFAAALASAGAPAPKDEEPEEVLDLTQEVSARAPDPEPVQTAPAPVQKVEDEVVFQPAEEPTPAPAPTATPSATSEIFSDKTRKALDDAFAKLDEVPVPEPSAAKFMPKPTSIEGNSVEAVFERAVREAVGPHIDQWMTGQKDDLLGAMKPLIRDWMDDHFPALLEGAVREEVARVLKARGQR